MRRRAVGQRVEEEAEATTKLFFAEAERAEEAFLNVLAVNTNAAGAEFVAVENEIVPFGPHFPRRGFELFQVFVDDAGEGMLGADPGFVVLAPFKKREAGNPQKFPLRAVDEAERFAELQTYLPGNERRGFRAFDLLFGAHGDNEIASLR